MNPHETMVRRKLSADQYKEKTLKLIKTKEKARLKAEGKILEMTHEINHKAKELKFKMTSDKSLRVSSMRLSTHATDITIDLEKRPSDRIKEIRKYTQMDRDAWKYDDLRKWFNKYSPTEVEHRYNPFTDNPGYTLQASDANE